MAPRPPPSDDLLLDAAAALVRRGEPLSVAAVATEAGVARGTVYKRFADREALSAALLASGRVAAAPGAEPDARERILDAVGVVLKRKGLAATTLDEVAREAGVGAVTVYRRFGDRRGLLQAFVAERSPRRVLAALPLDGSGDVEAGLLLLARESIGFFREHREVFLMSFSADPEARELVESARQGSPSVRGITAAFVGAHFPDPPGRTVQAFFGLLMSIAWSGEGAVEADAAFVVSTFLHGVSR